MRIITAIVIGGLGFWLWTTWKKSMTKRAEFDAMVNAKIATVSATADSNFATAFKASQSAGSPTLSAAVDAYESEVWFKGVSYGVHSNYRDWHNARLAEASVTTGVPAEDIAHAFAAKLMHEVETYHGRYMNCTSYKEREHAKWVRGNFWQANRGIILTYGTPT